MFACAQCSWQNVGFSLYIPQSCNGAHLQCFVDYDGCSLVLHDKFRTSTLLQYSLPTISNKVSLSIINAWERISFVACSN